MSLTVTTSAAARKSRRRATRAAAAAVAAAVLGAVVVRERNNIGASFLVLAHLHWLWIPVAVALEAMSMAAFACVQRRLLATGGASVGVATMLATSLAANALSVSIPLAGPELAGDFCVPALYPARNRRPTGRVVAASRRSRLCRNRRSGRSRRRSGVGQCTGHRPRRARWSARCLGTPRGRRGRAQTTRLSRDRTANELGAQAGGVAPAPAR